ncbi:hypothetical protein SAMN04488012_103214 [Palleronia salina]|uniref:Uncharacterized protein n=1 Tax=Palleronia salina TaxID=313368 RepID=A0A1M6ETS7_9RHOB|nr:hypothetical protein [Palleronia salina]SHI88798.1 hypothetical protein SAMN04488012_103214 [Palleronia salina]
MMHPVLNRVLFAVSLAVIAFCVSGLIVGWVGGNDLWVRGRAYYPAIVPTTQVSFFGLAVALLLATSDRDSLRLLAGRVCAAVIFIVALNICVRLTASDAGIDGMLPIALAPDDHMSYLTGGLIILACGLIGRTARGWPRRSFVDLSGALFGLTTVGSVTMAHSFDLRSSVSLAVADGLSVFTSIVLGIIFFAILMLQAIEPASDTDIFDDLSMS